MDLIVLDSQYRLVEVVDTFKSLIWTDRYSACGDFELFTTASYRMLDIFRKNSYVMSPYSNTIMFIEGIELISDNEDGDELRVIGRSLSSMLDRRVVWNKTAFSGNIQTGIKRLLTDAFISPSISDRKITNFVFKDSDDPKITGTNVDFEYYGESLYEVVESLCTEKKIGFRIDLTEDNKFQFSLYTGEDRSYEQIKNPIVIFSPNFDNIVSSNYLCSTAGLKNVAAVAIDNGDSQRIVTATRGDLKYSGLDRREISISGDSGKSDSILIQKGKEELDKNKGDDLFEGEIDSIHKYQYNRDFFIGDIVQMENAYGMSVRTIVTEFIRNESDSGIETYPSFEVVE